MDAACPGSVSVSVASVTSPEYGRTGYTKSISIPMTARNRELMGDCEQLMARDRFNASLHTARLEQEGCVIMEGHVMLTACEREEEGGRYRFNIIGAGKRWAVHAMQHTFSSLFPDYAFKLDGESIAGSWTAPVPVRWLPLQRQRYEPQNASVGLVPAQRVLTETDYHPFIHLRSVLHAIFEEAGYRLVSAFVDSAYFDSLYMSGNYPTRDATLLRSRMDFLAARFGEAATTADSGGRVYADPLAAYNTVGNIVDTADPDEERDGVSLKRVFTRGGCFRRDGERVVFVPPYSVAVGFEYRLRYVTGYRMAGSDRLAGFDRIYLGGGQLHRFRIANRFPDRRNEFRTGKEFLCIVFDHEEGLSYRLVADCRTGTGTVVQRTLAQFYSRSVKVSTGVAGTYGNLRMQRQEASGSFVDFVGDWALYDGYVAETGETEVEVTLRSAAETVTPGSPKYFDTLYFAGADEGMPFRLVEAEVRPVFLPHPVLGDTLSFAEAGAHDMNRMQVVNALREMFGLCFYTDEPGRTVYAEPRELFYRNDTVVDWSDRLDLSRPWKVSELAADVPGTLTWEYCSGDGASAAFNTANGGRLGRWSVQTGNPWRRSQERVYENPLFTTSVNLTGFVSSAPSASVVAAGDMDASSEGADDLNFPAKVVHYFGLRELPRGERWDWPGFAESYPFAAFHAPECPSGIIVPESPCGGVSDCVLPEESDAGRTLCYEDRDGAAGLHRWWDGLVAVYAGGVRLEAWVRLWPDDIEALIRPNYLMRDFRARFRLYVDGEWSNWRLEEVCDYHPSSPSTRCIFTKIV